MKKVCRIIGCVITLCLTVFFLILATKTTERKASSNKYADFFAQKENFDVLFMGSSHVINACFPMDLYTDYGISAYNCGGHSNQLGTTYWVMENALDYTKPKVMVIDCHSLRAEQKSSEGFSYIHYSFDAFPLSINKIKGIWDLLDDPVLEERMKESGPENRTKFELLWDFSVYHSRWNELGLEDFSPSTNLEKGAESRIGVVPSKLDKIDSSRKADPGHLGEAYLRKMIEDCRSRGIEVLLVYLPYPAREVQQMDANRVYDIAEEYGIHYINFLDLDVVDYQIDMYDIVNHLNPSGARKVTDYLGQFLTEHYDLTDKRTDPAFQFMEQDMKEYDGLKNKNLKSRENLYEYLMLLYADNVDVVMKIQDPTLFKDDLTLRLLANLGIDPKDLGEETDFILLNSKEHKNTVLNAWLPDELTQETISGAAQEESRETAFGTASLQWIEKEEQNELGLTLEGFPKIAFDVKQNSGITIQVYRGGKRVDQVNFTYSVSSSGLITTKTER